jgi:hypothetical protein
MMFVFAYNLALLNAVATKVRIGTCLGNGTLRHLNWRVQIQPLPGLVYI